MTGALLQLAAYGAQDIYLTGNPQITFFVGVYRRYTNFAIQNIRQNFYGNADFGQKVYCPLDPIGDLVHRTYLRVKLPSLKPYSYVDETGNPVHFYWVNSIGHAIIKIIEVEIGGVVVDRQYGIWMEIWSELTVDLSKREGYYQMIGKSENPINTQNENALDLFVPLQFWFNRFIGQALPLIALQQHQVRINVNFRGLSELIISSNGEPFNPSVNQKIGVPSTLSITETYLDVDYIFLEDEERKKFAKNSHQYLIEQIQVYATQLTTKGQQPQPNANQLSPELFHRVMLDFNHPVKELIWVLQNRSVLALYPYGGNEWFNFSTKSYLESTTVSDQDEPMHECKIIFEGKDRMDSKPGKYFRTVIPFQYHTNTPNNYIYCYSFSNNPQDFQPSGSCNFSRIDDKELYIRISDQLKEPFINVFAINYNILNIAGGMAGVEYSS